MSTWAMILMRRRASLPSVARHHHVRGLDDRVGIVADLQAELVDRFVGDRRGDHRPTRELDPHVGRGRALLHLDHLASEYVTRAELHGRPPDGSRGCAQHRTWEAPKPAG